MTRLNVTEKRGKEEVRFESYSMSSLNNGLTAATLNVTSFYEIPNGVDTFCGFKAIYGF